MITYYRSAGPENSAVIVVRESGEDHERSYSVSPEHARLLAEQATTSARERNELLAAAERYVLDAVSS